MQPSTCNQAQVTRHTRCQWLCKFTLVCAFLLPGMPGRGLQCDTQSMSETSLCYHNTQQ
jgi:hypothetical protein